MNVMFKKRKNSEFWRLYYCDSLDSVTRVPSLTRHILTYITNKNADYLKQKPIYKDLPWLQ